MLKNYVRIAWRNLVKSKIFSFINIFGLATGIAVAMLIGLWIYDEVSVNTHHKHYSTLYQVIMHQTTDGVRHTNRGMPLSMGDELKARFADFEGIAMCDWGGRHSLSYGDKRFSKEGYFIGEEAIDMFSFKVLNGDNHPLHDPYSIVLTEETAHTLFGEENPIGKIVKLDNAHDLKVTAVVAAQPKNATLVFDLLLPWQLQENINPNIKTYKDNWGNYSWRTFVQLNDHADPGTVNAKIKNIILDHFPGDQLVINSKPEVVMFPMSKWRLYADFENGVNTGGFIKYIRMFGVLGLIVLVIACINFMNLSTARSEKRAREVGIRKAVGSLRKQLMGQFLVESLFIAVLAFFMALGITAISLPYFNQLTEKTMSLQITNPYFWGVMMVFTVLTGLLAGSYPAFYLSSFNPVKVLKGVHRVGPGGALPRKILVVTQFACSVILMICTIIVYQQIQHGKNRPVGFNKSGLIAVNYSDDINRNFEPLQQDLLNSGAVVSVCKTNSPPTEVWARQSGWEWKGSQQNDQLIAFPTIATEYDYTKTLGIKIKEGRDFSRAFATDSSGVLLNEAAVKRLGLKNPVGEVLKWNGVPRTVTGIVPDMQMESPFQQVSPLMIVFFKGWVNQLCIRMNPGMSASEAISRIKPVFDKYNPSFPFEYKFADEEYARKFNYEELVGSLAAIIAVLAIVISCLGLFGLATFMAEQRTKEIGIRKVLGASVMNLWQMLSRDFVVLVLTGCAIAIPIAFYIMDNWLKQYQYKIHIGIWVFMLVLVLSVVVTLLTVSFQAIKAAIANPVKSLRTE